MELEMSAVIQGQSLAPITSLSWHAEGGFCASAASDGTLSVIDAAEGKAVRVAKCV